MTPIEKLVDFFGGQTKTAAALGVSQAAVSYWVRGAHSMGASTAFLAEELTQGLVTARDLCDRLQRKPVTCRGENLLAPSLSANVRRASADHKTVDTPVQPSSTAQASA